MANVTRASPRRLQHLQTPSLSPPASIILPSSSTSSSSPATSPSSSSSSSSCSRNGVSHKPPQQQHHHQQSTVSALRTKAPSGPAGGRRSVTLTSPSHPHRAGSPSSSPHHKDNADSGRVRIAVRVRPRSEEEVRSDADFPDCVELQPELKRLILRKNNWSSESYKFDELFTETASQRRVYEAVAKPVVESVLSGYNGTVMAYGQTGTGKTYTIGKIGKDDASQRGIMVRSLEDILSGTTSTSDVVEISYLQLYMESIQDMLAPEKVNIHINDDPKTGEVSIHGATLVKLRDLDHFLELMRIAEANRHAANTKQNTESSRSHAILVVFVRRSVPAKVEDELFVVPDLPRSNGLPRVRKSKMLIVDLAGSERIDKSGSARTSLIVMIGPSARNHAETSSTIMFGQRAMKIVNMVKLKEEFDYESQSRKLQIQVDQLTAEIEREHKLRVSEKHECERIIKECSESLITCATKSEFLEKEKTHVEVQLKDILSELDSQKAQNSVLRDRVAQFEVSLKLSQQYEIESSTYQKALTESSQIYDKKVEELNKQLEDERAHAASCVEQLDLTNKLLFDCKKSIQKHEAENASFQKALVETAQMYEKKIVELIEQQDEEKTRLVRVKSPSDQLNVMQLCKTTIQNSVDMHEVPNHHAGTATELKSLKSNYKDVLQEKARLDEELSEVKQRLAMEEKQRKSVEHELAKIKKSAPEIDNGYEDKTSMKENIGKPSSAHKLPAGSHKSSPLRESVSGQRASIAKMCEEVGLQKILQLLTSDDPDVQIHAVKVVANLASEDINQEKIVEEGGLDALLMLLRSSRNATILRVASGAIANLAMNADLNQGLIMSKGGAELLAETASRTDDPQTLRMVAGALANLCGNETLHLMLMEDGGIKALLGMANCGNLDVVAQVARGMANFAKCESRATLQGHRKGRSLLMDQGALEWLIANCNTTSASTRRHVELALCHLAQNESNVREFTSIGGSRELARISNESAREDIRSLAKKTMKMHPQSEIN
ncbi:Kinesin-like protein KIN-UC [Linum grandiflorum]